jgi:hypothetical protein
MTLKFQKGIFTSGKKLINQLLDFSDVLYNFEINCTSQDFIFRTLCSSVYRIIHVK